MRNRLASLSVVFACVALPACSAATSSENPGIAAAQPAVDGTLYLGTLKAGYGMFAKIERDIPAGNPEYLLDVSGDDVIGGACAINAYYSVAGSIDGFPQARTDDAYAVIAGVPNPTTDLLPAPLAGCESAPCPTDDRLLGPTPPHWTIMDEGVTWVFHANESLRIALAPTGRVVDWLTIKSICHRTAASTD